MLQVGGQQRGCVRVEGSDKAQGDRACRLSLNAEVVSAFNLWLSVYTQPDVRYVQLLKAGLFDDDDRTMSVTFMDWRNEVGILLPYHCQFVQGLAERVQLELVARHVEISTDLSQVDFTWSGEP